MESPSRLTPKKQHIRQNPSTPFSPNHSLLSPHVFSLSPPPPLFITPPPFLHLFTQTLLPFTASSSSSMASSSAAAAAPQTNARDRGAPLPPPAAPAAPPRVNPVYLHHLYQEAAPPQPVVGQEVKLFCSTLKWSILVFLGFASFFVMMWIIFHPTFPQLYVVSAAISAVSLNATAAVAECNASFALTNPNRHLTTVYDRMEISLVYASQQVLLSQFHHPTIVQPKRSQLTFQTNLSFSGADLGSEVIGAMKQELDQGSLGFLVKVSAAVKYRTGIWRTKYRVMNAYCGGVSFGFPSSKRPGIFLNPYQECAVFVFSKGKL